MAPYQRTVADVGGSCPTKGCQHFYSTQFIIRRPFSLHQILDMCAGELLVLSPEPL